jgi:hypothetical protein
MKIAMIEERYMTIGWMPLSASINIFFGAYISATTMMHLDFTSETLVSTNFKFSRNEVAKLNVKPISNSVLLVLI